jgi:hypothetical protein
VVTGRGGLGFGTPVKILPVARLQCFVFAGPWIERVLPTLKPMISQVDHINDLSNSLHFGQIIVKDLDPMIFYASWWICEQQLFDSFPNLKLSFILI